MWVDSGWRGCCWGSEAADAVARVAGRRRRVDRKVEGRIVVGVVD